MKGPKYCKLAKNKLAKCFSAAAGILQVADIYFSTKA